MPQRRVRVSGRVSCGSMCKHRYILRVVITAKASCATPAHVWPAPLQCRSSQQVACVFGRPVTANLLAMETRNPTANRCTRGCILSYHQRLPIPVCVPFDAAALRLQNMTMSPPVIDRLFQLHSTATDVPRKPVKNAQGQADLVLRTAALYMPHSRERRLGGAGVLYQCVVSVNTTACPSVRVCRGEVGFCEEALLAGRVLTCSPPSSVGCTRRR